MVAQDDFADQRERLTKARQIALLAEYLAAAEPGGEQGAASVE